MVKRLVSIDTADNQMPDSVRDRVAENLANTEMVEGAAVKAATVTLLKSIDAYRVTRSDVASVDAAPVVKAAIDAAVADGIRRVILPPATMTWGSQVAIPADAHGLSIEGYGEATTLNYTGNGTGRAMFLASGTEATKVALEADALAGATTVALPTAVASTLAVGDVLGLDCTTIVFGTVGSMPSRASELRKVTAISGSTVTLDGPLLWDYTLAASARAWRMSPIRGLSLSNFAITAADPAVNRLRGILVERATDLRIAGLSVHRAGGGGVFVYDTLDTHLSNITIDSLPNTGDFRGYGVVAGGRSAHMNIEGLSGRNFRHIFTTQPVTYDSNDWGGPRHVIIKGGVGEGAQVAGYSVWDTHPYGYDITFDTCRAIGGATSNSSGFQIRSKKTRLVNCSSFRAGARAVRVDPTLAADVEIVGGEFAYAAGEGMSLGADTRVSGAWIHHNGAQGITFTASAPRCRITNNRIEDNGLSGSNGYGLHDQSTTGTNLGTVVQGNAIPKSTSQPTAFLSPKGNTVYAGNVVLGYGAANDGVGGSPDGTVKRVNNITD